MYLRDLRTRRGKRLLPFSKLDNTRPEHALSLPPTRLSRVRSPEREFTTGLGIRVRKYVRNRAPRDETVRRNLKNERYNTRTKLLGWNTVILVFKN